MLVILIFADIGALVFCISQGKKLCKEINQDREVLKEARDEMACWLKCWVEAVLCPFQIGYWLLRVVFTKRDLDTHFPFGVGN